MATWLLIILLIIPGLIALWTLIALPALFGIPLGMRKELQPLTIEAAADELKSSGETGWDLVREATFLVHYRMKYSRCASFNRADSAFRRGYGYCQQQAFALRNILLELGFETEVKGATFTRLHDGRTVPHMWVIVTHQNEKREYCPVFPDPVTGRITFQAKSKPLILRNAFRIFTGWVAAGINGIGFLYRGEADYAEYE